MMLDPQADLPAARGCHAHPAAVTDGLVVARIDDRWVDDVGDPVGTDPRFRAVGGGAARDGGPGAGQRFAGALVAATGQRLPPPGSPHPC